MGLLDSFFAYPRPPSDGFMPDYSGTGMGIVAAPDDPWTATDPRLAEAAAARAAAAKKLAAIDPFAAADAAKAENTGAGSAAAVAALPQAFMPFAGLLRPQSTARAAPTGGQPDVPPSTNDPLAREPDVFEDGVPLPRPKPTGQGAGGIPMTMAPDDPDAKLPEGAKPTGQSGGGFFDTIKTGIGNVMRPQNAPTLLALGAGLSGAPSFSAGMSRGFAGAAATAPGDRAFGQTQETMGTTETALRNAGVPATLARAASRDPNILKAIAPKYFETNKRVPHEIGTDWLGNKIMGSFDPNTGKFYDAAGREIGGGGGSAASGGTSAVPAGMSSPLGRGVTEYNNELPADEYLKQFSPEVQAAIKDYASGDRMPTGNPRMKGFEPKIKEWAKLWGDKSGVPVSDALFSEKRKYRTELGSNSPSTAGGQAKAFEQGIDHMVSLADTLEKKGNWNGFGFPDLARYANTAREHWSTDQADFARKAGALGQTVAGEVGKLFSGQAGGGVEERRATAARFSTVSSGPELAGALEGTIETMEGGLRALESRRDQILGPNSDVKFLRAETEAKIAKIREVVARLRSGERAPSGVGAGAAPASAPRALPAGTYNWTPQGLVPAQ